MSEIPTLAFRYVNWRGDEHVYVIEPEKIECGPCIHPHSPTDLSSAIDRWVLHGMVVTRDGDPRPDMGTRRRTFLLGQIKDLAQVVSSVTD